MIGKGRIAVILGASDTGKTTLCRFLLQEALGRGLRSAYIDTDVGQSVIGPPTTLGMALVKEQRDLADPVPLRLYFLGATSPAQELLAAVAGARRLLEEAMELGVEFAVVDTTGLVAGDIGFRLKFYKIEVLSPTDLIAIRRESELEHILRAFRGRQRPKIHLLPPSRGVRRRDQLQRQLYRSGRFEAYFSRARVVRLGGGRVVINPSLPLADDGGGERMVGRVVGLIDREGFALGIGVFMGMEDGAIKVLTPVRDLEAVKAVQMGDLLLDRVAQKVCMPQGGLTG